MSRLNRRGFFGMLAGIFAAPTAIAALPAHPEEQPEPETTTTEAWGAELGGRTSSVTLSESDIGRVTVHYADGEYYDYNGQLIQGTYTGGVACS